MYENTESYDVLVKKLDSLGSIKFVINHPILIDMILSYSGDRHLTEVFFLRVSEEIESGNLSDDDLRFLRSSYLIRKLINLEECVLENKGRKLYKNELTDKISYLPEIGDTQVLINSLTSREMSSILFGSRTDDKVIDIREVVDSFYDDLPKCVQLSIVSEALLMNRQDMASDLFNRVNEEKSKTL